MEQPYLAPRRADLQCHLWDCHRCLLPYCMGIHKTVAMSSEADTRAAVIVDGITDNAQLVASEKCLRGKLLNFPCGAPILPVHVLFIHPWQQGEVFDLAVGPNERERLFLFSSEPEPPQHIQSIWRHIHTRWAAANVRMRSWYLRFPIVQNGFFRLTQFSIMGHGRAIYWLLFRPYIPEIIIQEPGTVEMPNNIPDPRPSNQPSPDSPTDSQPSGLSEVGDCSASESPFPVAGISITFMLNQRLDLDAGIPRRIVLDNLLRLLSVEESAADIRHCTAFKLIDQQWLSMLASFAFNRKYIDLLYFAWNSKKSFQDLQWKQASDCSVSEYRSFVRFPSVNGSAFDLCNCIAFKLMGQQWLSRGASYMEFNKSFQDLQWKQAADCCASEYRNFVAGINITTVMLIERLELEAGIPRRIVLDNLLRLLSVEESASDIRHCTAFKLIDQQWLSMRASVAFNRKYINLLYFAWDSKKSFQDLQWKQASDCFVSEYHNFIHGI